MAFTLWAKLRLEYKLPVCRQILRKQCVNILFQLGVFFDIHRKSHFRKTLIFSTLSKQRYIIEYHFKILIIWRSQVQALAGPRWKSSTCKFLASAFSFISDLLETKMTSHNLQKRSVIFCEFKKYIHNILRHIYISHAMRNKKRFSRINQYRRGAT